MVRGLKKAKPRDEEHVLLVASSCGHGAAGGEPHLARLLADVGARLPDQWVGLAFLTDGEPSVEDAIEGAVGAGARRIAVLPLLVTPGRETETELPVRLGRLRFKYPETSIIQAPVVGEHAGFADLVAQAASDAVASDVES